MHQIAATLRRDRLLQQIASCGMWKKSLLQRKNEHKQPNHGVCTQRVVVATKFKSANEGASIFFSMTPQKMATKHVEQDKQPEQSEVSSFRMECNIM